MDSKSGESLHTVVAIEDKEYCEEVLLKPHISSQSKYTPCASVQAPLSKDSTSTSEDDDDDDDDVQSGPDRQTKQPPKLQWSLPSHHQKSSVHTFTGGPRGKNYSEATHINDVSRPLSVSMSYFTETVTLPVVETNRYYHW